jgi:hypothetical protein
MTTVQIDVYLKDCLKWNYVDLFYAYCKANGVDYPEDDLTEEEYDQVENEFAEKVNRKLLDNLVSKITRKVDELMVEAFK